MATTEPPHQQLFKESAVQSQGGQARSASLTMTLLHLTRFVINVGNFSGVATYSVLNSRIM